MDKPFYESSFGSPFNSRAFDDVSFLGADRQPCMICGHPTGDCSGDSPKLENKTIAGFGVSGLESRITFLVEEDIYEERQITPFTKTKVMLHKKGKQISFDEARRLGLLEKS
jgi:hypothetical protein